VFSTALALVIYFRLINTLGSVGTTSQAYLRVPIGVAIGVVFLGEHLTSSAWIGLACVLAGVAAMTIPRCKEARCAVEFSATGEQPMSDRETMRAVRFHGVGKLTVETVPRRRGARRRRGPVEKCWPPASAAPTCTITRPASGSHRCR